MQKIKININGEEKEGFIVDKIYRNKKRKVINGKTYEWEEYYIHVYVPAELRNRKFLIVPI